MLFQKAREFIYRNARPLELTLWKYHFENGTKEEVLEALAYYQNDDGGFGNALEPDVWNPNSIPMGTWRATTVLESIGFDNATHPIIQGILRFLDSGSGFDERVGQWQSEIPSNNDFPHAVWFHYEGEISEFGPNPTAALAGFIIAYMDKDSKLYKKACDLAVRCYKQMLEKMPQIDMHDISCYLQLYHYLVQSDETELIDLETFRDCLEKMVNVSICKDTSQWGNSYVSLPSRFIDAPDSFLYNGLKDLVEAECELIKRQQLSDGSFTVPWTWCNDYKEFEVAKNWWKSEMIINKLLFLKNFSEETLR